MTSRPDSLFEVAARTTEERLFEYELADFLHEFERRRDRSMLEKTPPLLREKLSQGPLFDAYLAAVAVELSRRQKRKPPAWVVEKERYLEMPWFASAGRHMRALLLHESPSGFRERNLFVTANALSIA